MACEQLKIFGVIVAGRAIQTNFIQMSDKEFVVEVDNPDVVNHIVVFLTGVLPFPEGMGGSVYICWQKSGVEMNWYYLGYISNDKPSAIFRVSQLRKKDVMHTGLFTSMARSDTNKKLGNAHIGVSVEPIANIISKNPSEETAVSQQSTLLEFLEKMVQNFVNHVLSFAVRMPRIENPREQVDFIPTSAIQNWYSNFSQRLQQNPEFWKSLP
ncbi:unnamed protein product [Thelazia callipaeda]|uniref:DUF775 domain-containing protein n=1 Tax=Thelazia callipaeda TaxID=103827 RepID=A0A0N5CUS4_THECL|nr:unnamed protein product [Thelazia callipaeda]